MQSLRTANTAGRRGFASSLALASMLVLVALAVAFVHDANLSLQAGRNLKAALHARLTAESGLSLMLRELRGVRLPPGTDANSLLPNLYTVLSARLNGSENLSGQSVTYSSLGLYVPDVEPEPGRRYHCLFTSAPGGRCRLRVTGQSEGASRNVAMVLKLSPRLPLVFSYGLASKGSIEIGGHTRIVGVNNPQEANVFSATTSTDNAIYIGGSTEVSGDLFVSGDYGCFTIEGNPTIAGSTDPTQYFEHMHAGVDPPDFPALETSHLIPLAVNVVDSSTNTAGQTFNNIRILPNTNPTFSSTTVLNGIVYVQAPNVVKFEGQTQINGFIVTEDNGSPLPDCQLRFAGTANAGGVEALPDTPEFAAVKQHTGSFLIAPGFGAVFSGNFQTINGSLMADQLTFSGTAEGTIKGTVVGLEDLPTTLAGNVEIRVDRSDQNTNPAGVVRTLGFDPLPETYEEPVGE